MALEEYQKKRDFGRTPEPSGRGAQPSVGPPRFVVQKHQASQLHYDFRLEHRGKLLSWAVPKGPSVRPGDRHLAMMVEDHPLDYRSFEGIIPEGNYGAGTVMVWDEGNYLAYDSRDRATSEKAIASGLKKGHLTFILNGQKLKGEFALIRLENSKEDNAWLLIKADKDEYARDADITKEDKSAKTGRSLEQIAAQAETEWTREGEQPRDKAPELNQAPKSTMPHDVTPMLATLTETVPSDPGWYYEVKWDGYRALAATGRSVRLYSRNGQDFRAKFQPVTDALKGIKDQLVLDGEVVVVDDQGRSRFQLLQNYQRTGEGRLVYYVFDILFANGHDVAGWPLSQRKRLLQQLLPENDFIKISEHLDGDGQKFFETVVKQGLEGVMAKRADSLYQRGKRGPAWLKIKAHMRQEAVVGGYTDPRGSRHGLGALVLGVYDGDQLVYIGHTGGGFDDQSLREATTKLEPLQIKKSPFAVEPKTNAPVHWVKPQLVCEVKFAEWTEDGQMRQPIFVGWREDKDTRDVRRELPSETLASGPAAVSDHLKLTHLDKVFWPDEGYTKGDLINYYRDMASLILPYIKDRPQSLNRHPNGIKGQSFYQKDLGDQAPRWAKTIKVYSESNDKDINYLVCQDVDTLLYMANLGCIEINPWFSTTKHLDQPDYAVIDLDPEDIGFEAVVKTALAVREALDDIGVPSYPKTSGATGLHIFIPLGAKYSYDQAKQFAEIVARLTNAKLPSITSVERQPAKRQKRVYLDFLQNRRGQTLASAYSVRPQPGATVSAPLKWEEVNDRLSPSQFTIKNIAARVDKVGELWQPVLGKGIDLAKALQNLEP